MSPLSETDSGARRGPTLNRCNLPPWVIRGQSFQDNPQPLELDGISVGDRRLWALLKEIHSESERARVFHEYMTVKFRLHEWELHERSARASLRHSYLQCLHGWGVDSNGRAGAVLKAWVESRFGLAPTYHSGVLASEPKARMRYLEDRMRGAARTIGVNMQLDLLYTYCQHELRRRHPEATHLTLYRGTHDPDEYRVLHEAQDLVELNNLSSFTSEAETAWEFGSSVWELQIPLPKIVFFSGLLPPHLLGGEAEHLVLGGLYRVRRLRC